MFQRFPDFRSKLSVCKKIIRKRVKATAVLASQQINTVSVQKCQCDSLLQYEYM